MSFHTTGDDSTSAKSSAAPEPTLPYYPLAFKGVTIRLVQGYNLPSAARQAAIAAINSYSGAGKLLHAIDDLWEVHTDLGALSRSLRLGDWETATGYRLDASEIRYVGQSLGGILGALYTMISGFGLGVVDFPKIYDTLWALLFTYLIFTLPFTIRNAANGGTGRPASRRPGSDAPR